MVKGLAEGILLGGIFDLFGEAHALEIYTDSSAARGVVMRTGSGKLKHLSTKQLWIQEHVADGKVLITKTPREQNPADALTHGWSVPESRFFSVLGIGGFAKY